MSRILMAGVAPVEDILIADPEDFEAVIMVMDASAQMSG